ncbi:hypothetical protein ALI44B_13175 [Leifsonia sp. ALI-44-B]|jgi:uncharacterized protein (DUF1697 family)|uniref:DUF1697 domain-containing protein n=1 Tax=Leifsonia sp. ALI-44-B TaxID=1933776 RepID=UPI00097BAF19|nr:DUF1697 domain-containing protein [Leifsonia sp. ALI-44-B]ONI61371.1 hypothetical protein ALI44B_13175 [Leifsonia sp. ALI-44-B]
MPTTWVGLLRGVNVGGNTIKSADLVAALQDAGFARVKTVLASGNVLVEGPNEGAAQEDSGRAEIRRRLESAIDVRYGYGVAVAVVRLDEMQAVIDAYPFDEVPDRHPYVTFATDRALIDALAEEAAALRAEGPTAGAERLAVGDGVMYWEVAKGSSTDSPFAKISSRARYRTGAEAITTRNLRTLRKLVW